VSDQNLWVNVLAPSGVASLDVGRRIDVNDYRRLAQRIRTGDLDGLIDGRTGNLAFPLTTWRQLEEEGRKRADAERREAWRRHDGLVAVLSGATFTSLTPEAGARAVASMIASSEMSTRGTVGQRPGPSFQEMAWRVNNANAVAELLQGAIFEGQTAYDERQTRARIFFNLTGELP
jgi:hypothetical protein